MKTYKQLKEDIGLSTGAGIANFDPIMGRQSHRFLTFEDLGLCYKCHKPLMMVNGIKICQNCYPLETSNK